MRRICLDAMSLLCLIPIRTSANPCLAVARYCLRASNAHKPDTLSSTTERRIAIAALVELRC